MPNSKRRFVAAVSLLLALLLLLSGCSAAVPVPAPERTPAPTPAAAPTATPAPLPTPEPPAREAMVQFSAISYQRPDLEETLDTLSGCLAALSGCTAPEALDAAKRADACYDAFATMETVAQIRSSMDKSVAYWAEEEALLSSWSPQVEEAYEAVYRALKDGPHRAALEESQGPTFFRKISPIDSFTEVTVPLFEQENELMNRYDTIRYTGTVPVEGKDYTLDELYGMEDRAVRKEAYDRWEESHGKALEELYLELIKLRNRIARELGFENYPEYVYAVEERPYTVDMTLALISDIRSTLAPAYARYCENTSLYPDRADLPLEAFLPALETILEDMDPKLAQSFSAMQEYGLCDLALFYSPTWDIDRVKEEFIYQLLN